MNRDEAFLSAYEHLFVLGCGIPHLNEGVFLAEEHALRGLYIFPFHPACLIDILSIADMAEVILYWEVSKGNTEIFNLRWRWFRSIIEAFEMGTTPSTSLPETYRFVSQRANLSSTQFQWIKENLWTIPFESLTSDNPPNGQYRDGLMFRVQTRNVNSLFISIDSWAEHHEDESVYRCFLYLYQLACSALSDLDSRLILVSLQRYFFGVQAMSLHDFIFPLIR